VEVDALKQFLTDKGGWLAALGTVVALIGGVLGIVRPSLQRRRDAAASRPALEFANLRCEDPPPHSEAGRATFELVNTGGGTAVLTDLRLIVIEHGASEEPKMIEAAAPVPVYTYKVTLAPDVAEYDVRKREFGSEGPHSFAKGELESVVVELRSSQPQWYRVEFVARWYDGRQTAASHEVRSGAVRIEFRPGIEDLLGEHKG
jgi:hypothetical protein